MYFGKELKPWPNVVYLGSRLECGDLKHTFLIVGFFLRLQVYIKLVANQCMWTFIFLYVLGDYFPWVELINLIIVYVVVGEVSRNIQATKKSCNI